MPKLMNLYIKLQRNNSSKILWMWESWTYSNPHIKNSNKGNNFGNVEYGVYLI